MAATRAFEDGKKGFLIADGMGSGKTLQALLTFLTLRQRGHVGNLVIITKATLCSMWEERAKASGLDVGWIKKSPAAGVAEGQLLPHSHAVTITNYSLAIRPKVMEMLRYVTGSGTMVILDESHAAKSTGKAPAKISQALWGLGRGKVGLCELAGFTLCLTGTPTPNGRASELHGFLSLVDKGVPRNYWKYAAQYCGLEKQSAGGREFWVEARNTNEDEWIEKVDRFRIQRPVSAFVDLPPVSWTEHPIEPPKALLRELAEDDERMQGALDAIELGANPDFTEFSAAMRKIGSAKVPYAVELIQDLFSPFCPLVVFVRHNEVLDAVEEGLKDKLIVQRMDSGMGGVLRGIQVERFQSGEGGDVFLTTLGVASEGITLTRASTAVLVEQDFTPGRVSQAVARICRMGQERHCTIHRITMDGTIDDRLTRILDRKSQAIERQEG